MAALIRFKEANPTAWALLGVMSMLDGESIPEEILTTDAEEVELANYPPNLAVYLKARKEVMEAFPITRDELSSSLRIRCDIQDMVRNALDDASFRDVFNAATRLQHAVWPFIDSENLNRTDRFETAKCFQPHISRLRSALESRGVGKLQPTLLLADLFNESSWTYQLQGTSDGLRLGDEYAVLAQEVVETSENKHDDDFRSQLLADSYRFQGIIGSYQNTGKAVPCTKKWVDRLYERIEKYQSKQDIDTMPIAWNEYGRALMRLPDKKEAMSYWERASIFISDRTKAGELPFPYPWFHRALINAFDGKQDLAESIILPILEERENKLGKDDVDTYETGMILTCMGHIRRAQGHLHASHMFNKRAASVVPSATGESSLASLTAYYRLAVDKFALGKFNRAHKLLQKVLDGVGDDSHFKAIAARANWKMGRTVGRESGDDDEQAKIFLDQAMKLRHELVPDDKREEENLKDIDWDSLVFYLFR
ncbi:uncharacterized protein K460DRAFT_422532 [Cucurbitaria berberidis CBS 394.84]|uniref:DUF7779 domain-containing protein n=1 Tax=Cucurbitaria berberidis CBS 394.84 TaxID=1168544 RepID=A0A9P4LDH6_9PLEO|nr:uncharacterized protein K460DRAFT_422532 [Cucurbitaria berberidis CBS 394.84]KAF1850114.1 hypothetical protein K460DRAFT_422532 [Cucurbitaria berberidis CBS 394.84]